MTWTPPYTAWGFFLMDRGLSCVPILVTYDSVYSPGVNVSLHRVTVIVIGWMNVCLALKADKNVNLTAENTHDCFLSFLLFYCRWVRQWSARGDGHGGVQSPRRRILCGGGNLEPGRVHTLHLQEGTCPVRHWSLSPGSLPDTYQEQGHLLPRMPR